MSGAGTGAGACSTGTSIVIVRVSSPGALGFGAFPEAVTCQAAFSSPFTVIVDPPAQTTPEGQSSTPDHVTQVEVDVQGVLEVGVCWLPAGAHDDAIMVREVVESVGWPLES